jgi:peptidoglycan lytic transglycosylase G
MSTRRPTGREPQLSLRPRSPAEALEPARAPSRPRGRARRESRALSAVVRLVSGIFTIMLVAMAVFGGVALLLNHHLDAQGPLEVTRTVSIPKGEGRIEIAERLEREGVIGNRWSFVVNHLLQGWLGARKSVELKAGEYEIKKGASMRQVMEIIADGRSVLAKLTVPEGLTSLQIVERIKADANLSGDVAEVPEEGSLLPETYRFSRGMPRQEIVDRMRADQQRTLAALWEKRQPDLPLQTMEQAVILASIVEKETARSDERDRVAAVFINRLRKGMPLQSDPTILYGLYGGAVQWGKPILKTEIEAKNPHNTYQVRGLPPTPICNPGRPAIEAVLNPAKTSDLYFVADGNGGHTFSETLKDHNAAVQTWRKLEKDIRAKQEAPAPGTRAAARQAPAGDGQATTGEPDAQAGEPAAATPAPAAPAPASAAPAARKQKKQEK